MKISVSGGSFITCFMEVIFSINSKMIKNGTGLSLTKTYLRHIIKNEQVRMSWSVPWYSQQKR